MLVICVGAVLVPAWKSWDPPPEYLDHTPSHCPSRATMSAPVMAPEDAVATLRALNTPAFVRLPTHRELPLRNRR